MTGAREPFLNALRVLAACENETALDEVEDEAFGSISSHGFDLLTQVLYSLGVVEPLGDRVFEAGASESLGVRPARAKALLDLVESWEKP